MMKVTAFPPGSMSKRVRVVRGWVWPGLVFVFSGVLLATFWKDAPWFVRKVDLYSPVVYTSVVYGVGWFLAWRYRRSRVAAVLLGLFIMDVLLRPLSATLEPGVGSLWDASGVLFLLLLPVVAAMKDRGVLSPRGLLQLAIILTGLAGGLIVWAVRSDLLAWTWQTRIPWDVSVLQLSDAALAVGLFALLLTGGIAVGRGHHVDKGFFWISVVFLLALRSGPDSAESTIYLTMAGLMLIVSVLEQSYAFSFHDNVTHLPARRALRREITRARASYALALVGVDHHKTLHDCHGGEVRDRVMRKVANHLRKAGAQAFRYSDEEFALVFAGKGHSEVLGDLEVLREEIEDFRFSLRSKTAEKGQGEVTRHPSALWPLTVTVGVAERGDKGGWSARYGAIAHAARMALHRGQRAGGNAVWR
jgi:diguanylate cyclase (GGDEF)-like protein